MKRRPHNAKDDGRDWRDVLLPDEKAVVEKYESLLTATNKVSFNMFPKELRTIRDRACQRLYRERQGKKFLRKDPKLRAASNAKKLNWQKVREIRMSGDAYDVLAKRYGVSYNTIRKVREGEIWVERPGEKYPRSKWLSRKRAAATRMAKGIRPFGGYWDKPEEKAA